MNPVRKRLRLSPSKPAVTVDTIFNAAHSGRVLRSSPQYDTLLPPVSPAAVAWGGAKEEEGYLLVEKDVKDSSLIITMGKTDMGEGAHTDSVVQGSRSQSLFDCFLSLSEDSQGEVKTMRKKTVRNKKRKLTKEEGGASESEGEAGVEVEIDRQLDQSLETKSKQHNLTTVNVRNIIHVSLVTGWSKVSLKPAGLSFIWQK